MISGEGLPNGIPWSERTESTQVDALKNSEVVLIGYPADDPRNSVIKEKEDRAKIFRNVYNVKRLQPGVVLRVEPSVISHDASTLGGNSGSGR